MRENPRLRLLVGLLATLLFTQFVRTMAADTVPTGDSTVASAPGDPSPPTSESPAPAPSESTPQNAAVLPPQPVQPAADPLASSTPSPSPSPSPTPPHAISNQSFTIQIPSSVAVDPRANTVSMPQIYAQGSAIVLACLSSNHLTFTSSYPDSLTSGPNAVAMVSGEMTSSLLVSGTLGQVLSVINSSTGLRVRSLSGGLANQVAIFKFIAISEPSLNPALCADGSMSNSRTVFFQPLGVTLDMKNGNVTLKR